MFLNIDSTNNFDPVVSAWLQQLSTPPSGIWLRHFNRMIKGHRKDGNLLLLDRLWIFATEVQAHAKVSVVNPSSTQITEVNTPAWVALQGYTGNGSSSYLNSNFAPSAGVRFLLNTASFGVYSRTSNAALSKNCMAVNDATNGAVIYERAAGDVMYVQVNSANVADPVTNTLTTGLLSNTRMDSATVEGWRNGASLGTVARVSSARVAINFFIGARNNNGSAVNFSTLQLSMAYIGGGIDQKKFYNRMQTFMTALGTQV